MQDCCAPHLAHAPLPADEVRATLAAGGCPLALTVRSEQAYRESSRQPGFDGPLIVELSMLSLILKINQVQTVGLLACLGDIVCTRYVQAHPPPLALNPPLSRRRRSWGRTWLRAPCLRTCAWWTCSMRSRCGGAAAAGVEQRFRVARLNPRPAHQIPHPPTYFPTQLLADPYLLSKFKSEVAEKRARAAYMRTLDDIARTLRAMGLHHTVQATVEDGLVAVDVALPDYRIAFFLTAPPLPSGGGSSRSTRAGSGGSGSLSVLDPEGTMLSGCACLLLRAALPDAAARVDGCPCLCRGVPSFLPSHSQPTLLPAAALWPARRPEQSSPSCGCWSSVAGWCCLSPGWTAFAERQTSAACCWSCWTARGSSS